MKKKEDKGDEPEKSRKLTKVKNKKYVAKFQGIKIEIYAEDHEPPHVHCKYQGMKMKMDIHNLIVIKGALPPQQIKKVKTFIKMKKEVLMCHWDIENQSIDCENVLKKEEQRKK
ncbi:MAG: DUF4160 domain-containing protein [Bacteroidota bacterium]